MDRARAPPYLKLRAPHARWRGENSHFRQNAKTRVSHFGENMAPEGPGFGLGERRVGRLGETFRVKTRSRACSTLVFHQRTQRDPQSCTEDVVGAKLHFACTRGPLAHAHSAWQSCMVSFIFTERFCTSSPVHQFTSSRNPTS